jgi:2-methylcitrate dehydratase
MNQDHTTERLVDFAEGASYAALPAGTVHECKRRLVDTIASALGAFNHPVSQMARAFALRSKSELSASLWGTRDRVTLEGAAFANGVMVRSLDISDTYLGLSRGHPSDMISGIIAVAEHTKASGKEIINAITLAYDIYCSFCQIDDVNAKGWDQPLYGVLGCVLGVGKLLGLDHDQMGHALSLALAPNMALAQSRRGHLSAWKGCAGANGSRNAVFAALLAKDGFTGPTAVFEGDGGLWQVIGKQQWLFPEGQHLIGETHTKSLPICYHGQSAVLGAFQLRDRVKIEKVEEIRIDTYRNAFLMMGGEPSRWSPTTRETADHSMPYVVACALLDGAVNDSSFSERRMNDEVVRALMKKIRIFEDEALTVLYPESAPARVSIHHAGGELLTIDVRYPKGHAKNPMSDAEIDEKFAYFVQPLLGYERSQRVLAILWDFENVADISEVTAQMSQ